MKNKTTLVALIAAAAFAGGCATQTTPNTRGLGGGDYNRAQARGVAAVEIGTIESVRAVRLDAAEGRATGVLVPAIGALAGGAIGNQVGKGDGKKVGAVLGALAGGYAGHAVQKQRDNIDGLEITVRIGSRLIAVTQADEGIGFHVGDRVQVIHGRGASRVAPL